MVLPGTLETIVYRFWWCYCQCYYWDVWSDHWWWDPRLWISCGSTEGSAGGDWLCSACQTTGHFRHQSQDLQQNSGRHKQVILASDWLTHPILISDWLIQWWRGQCGGGQWQSGTRSSSGACGGQCWQHCSWGETINQWPAISVDQWSGEQSQVVGDGG